MSLALQRLQALDRLLLGRGIVAGPLLDAVFLVPQIIWPLQDNACQALGQIDEPQHIAAFLTFCLEEREPFWQPHSTWVCRAVRSRGCKAKRASGGPLFFTHCLRQLAISILLSWQRRTICAIFEETGVSKLLGIFRLS